VLRSRVPDELELIPLLAGGASQRAAAAGRVRALLARADFGYLERALAERRLLPLIGSRAIEAGGDLVPDAFRGAVEQALAAGRARALAFEWAVRQIAGWLAEAGIRVLPLKGPLLADEAHGDPGVRATSDVDLLVATEDLDAAGAVLVEHGYSPPTDRRRANGLPDLHLTLLHPKLPQAEVHWRIHWDERGLSPWLLARAAPGADGLLRARPDDLVASLLLFHARDGFQGIRPVADLAAWWERHGHELPPAFLEQHVRRHPELAMAFSAAARAVEDVVALPATSWLGDAAVGGRRVAMATRLADWAQYGDRQQLRANMSLVSGLLGPPRSARPFVRRELLSYGSGAAARAAHVAKMCGRYVLGLWGIRRGRSWMPAPMGDAHVTGSH
jgi:hypothetical protein